MIQSTAKNEFYLATQNTSYIVRVLENGYIENLYYGRRIPMEESFEFLYDKHSVGYGNATAYSQEDTTLSMDHICLESSSYGKGDYRLPSIQISTDDGVFTSDFKYTGNGITDVKPELNGLPSSYGPSQTLTLVLEDASIGAQLHLIYTVFEDCDVITRSSRLICGKTPFKIHSLMSMQLDLPFDEYTMMTFDGAWSRERYLHEKKINQGVVSMGSTGGVSSNRHNPFFVVRRDDCTQDAGNCYGFNLVYSGNHIARVETGSHDLIRIQNGINPFEFEWLMKEGDVFDTPEAVMTFSDRGLNGMSRNMHHFVKEHIVRGEWKYKERPVLVNNWEATFFNFTEKKILNIAKAGKAVGAEMFVLDDGWFGKRNNDHCSLGDWYVNKKKLPSGIGGLAKKINDMGLKFGLWFEPEMISIDSDLYRAHPDWAVTIDRYTPSQGRNQLVLDLTREDVRTYLINVLTDVLKSGNIEYVKWDMNRQFSDVFSHREGAHQGEFFHRYVLGLYEILDALVARFPHILFESCSSGGNRFDLGMFCYMPQCWTSDNTDALDRMRIQTGTSYGYPQSVMCMHVSDSPSFAGLRPASIEHRFNVASFGLLGYELDVTKLSSYEKSAVKKQIEYYKQHRKVLQFGDFYRIGNAFTDDLSYWVVVSEDKKQAMLGMFTNRIKPNYKYDNIRFAGLDPEKHYHMEKRTQSVNLRQFDPLVGMVLPIDTETSKVYDFVMDKFVRFNTEKDAYDLSGAALMYSGFKPKQMYASSGFNLKCRLLLDNDSRVYYAEEKAEK